MLAVKEERTFIGGVELARKTVVAADNQGIFVAFSQKNFTNCFPCFLFSVPLVTQPCPPPVLPSPPVILPNSPPPKEFSWVKCCFKCESGYEWYEIGGKGKYST
ncbi:unnamed protein product [Porites lobata]|uniref:Uncharacterized protein n=1 Tax=Porites lobata TaxID=104759 RepID=A0ABN8NCR0_9CNID|nr:unnamed protein product [Porites lobata]